MLFQEKKEELSQPYSSEWGRVHQRRGLKCRAEPSKSGGTWRPTWDGETFPKVMHAHVIWTALSFMSPNPIDSKDHAYV